MKKLFALLLALSLLLTLAACGGGEQVANTDDNKETTANTTDATTDTTDATQDSTENTEGTTEATTPESTTPPTTEPQPTETTPPETKPTHKHNYSSKVTKAATCTADGVKTFTCSCGKSYTESIKATGHSYSSKTTREPTCAVEGIKTYTCTCGDTYTESIKTTAHSYTMRMTADSTGKDEGTKTYTCTCGDTYTETFKLSTIFKGFVNELNDKWNNGGPDYEYGTGEGFVLVHKYVGFSTTDGINFAINYQEEYYDSMEEPPFQVNDATMKVELKDNNFVVTKWY